MFRAKIVLGVTLLVLMAGVITFVNPRSTEAQVGSTPVRVVNTPLPVTGTVNVGNFPPGGGTSASVLAPRKASDLVTLRSSGQACGSSPWRRLDTRINANGTLSTPFVIPSGQVLIVTSVDWRQGSTAGGNRHEEFYLFPSEENIDVVFFPIAMAFAVGSGDGRAGVTTAVTGVAISAGTPCWGVNNLTQLPSADVLVHGFLAADE
jgi:hypothetical protein